MNISDYVIIIIPTKSDTRFHHSEFNSIWNFSQSDCSIKKYSAEWDRIFIFCCMRLLLYGNSPCLIFACILDFDWFRNEVAVLRKLRCSNHLLERSGDHMYTVVSLWVLSMKFTVNQCSTRYTKKYWYTSFWQIFEYSIHSRLESCLHDYTRKYSFAYWTIRRWSN